MYEKFVMTTPPVLPQDVTSDAIKRIAFMDNTLIEDAPYFEAVWCLKDIPVGPARHTHDFDEYLGYMGIDPTTDALGCTVEIEVGDELLTMTKNFIMRIPAGVPHCPMRVLNLTRPVINYSGGPNIQYLRTHMDGSKRVD